MNVRLAALGLSILVATLATTSAPVIGQTPGMRGQPQGTMRETGNALPGAVRAPNTGRGDANRAGQSGINTSSNVGRETNVPSFGTLTIQGNQTGGTGTNASGPKQDRPGGKGGAGKGNQDPITPDEFGRAKQLDDVANGKSRRVRDEANAKNKDAPGSQTGADLVNRQQNASGGLYGRPQTSKRDQQSSDGDTGGGRRPGLQKDGTFVFASTDQMKGMTNQQRERYNGELRLVERSNPDASRPDASVGSRLFHGAARATNPNYPYPLDCKSAGNCEGLTTGHNGSRGRPAPDAVDNSNPMRPASIRNTGNTPFDPVETTNKRRRQVTQPGDREAREANLQALRGRRLDSSFGTDPNVVNPTRGDGTSANRPANPAGSSRPGSQPGGRNCPVDNPTC